MSRIYAAGLVWAALIASAAGLVVPVAASASVNFPPGGISVPASGTQGPANAYPSTIGVSGYNGTITKVMVYVRNLSHTHPDDLDVVLVGPGGQKVSLMSDAGGSGTVTGGDLRFEDSAASFVPDSGPLTSGAWKPSNYDAGESLTAPAPAGPYDGSLASFNGTNPNGTWSLYVDDDALVDVGSFDGWALNITTTAGFQLADPGVATDYPSTLTVSGLTGPITKLTAQLNDVAHSDSTNIDALLVGPGGQRSILMSDAGNGGSTLYDSVALGFDDEAPSLLPSTSTPRSGTYKPTDYSTGVDSFPAPAPAGPYPASLSSFIGTDPNGTWKLFALDDTGPGYSGSILAGFSIAITTPSGTTTVPAPAQTDRVRPSGSLGFSSRRFKAASTGGPVGASRASIGTRVTFKLSEAATAKFTVERATRGVRRGGRCQARRRGTKGGRPCTRYVALRSSFARDGVSGSNSFKFTGRLGGKKLSPRRYRLSMVARDAAGNSSAPATAGFRIVR